MKFNGFENNLSSIESVKNPEADSNLKNLIEHKLGKTGFHTEDDNIKDAYIEHIEKIYQEVKLQLKHPVDDDTVIDSILRFRGADDFISDELGVSKKLVENVIRTIQENN